MSTNELDPSEVDRLLAAAFAAPAATATRAPAQASAPEISARYRIEGEIGRGGVGVVMRGRDLELGRDVAIKILRAEHRDHAGLTRRFVEEAQIGGQLEHPGIVPVHEMGQSADGRPYFAMKLVQGRTLAELLKARRKPGDDAPRWLAIFEQVCQTVAYAHARGVVHRDLKPANVILGAFGEVQVADWGLAKVVGRPEPAPGETPAADANVAGADGADSADGASRVSRVSGAVSTSRTSSSELLSQAGSVLGTLAYMPPEQARGESEKVDTRSDVFALGAMLCEILTGAPPYTGEASDVLDAARAAQVGPALSRLDGAGADPELIALAKRCLAADRDARPRDASEVAAAVTRHRVALQERAHAAELAAAAAHARAVEERRARKLVAALAGTVILGLLIGGGTFLKSERDESRRLLAATDRFNDAFARAKQHVDVARKAPPTSPEPWRAALASAEGALSSAVAGDLDDARRDEAETLRSEASSGLARAESVAASEARDLATFERLAFLIGKWEIWPWAEIDEGFHQEFQEWGLDFDTMTDEQIVERVLASSNPIEISDFLLAWVRVRAAVAYAEDPERANTTEPRDFTRTIRILRQVDPDPMRVRIRAAIPHNVQDLLAILAEPTLWEQEPRTIAFLGSILANFRRPAEAIDLFHAAADRYPTEFIIRIELAGLLTSRDVRRWAEAVDHASAAVALAPESTGSWLLLGVARDGTGDFEGAIGAFERAIALDSRTRMAHFGKAIAEIRTGRDDAALASLRTGLEAFPGSDDLRYGLAVAHLGAGRLTEARVVIEDLLRRPQEGAKDLHAVGRAVGLLLLLDDVRAAEREVRAALAVAPRDMPILEVLALRDLLAASLEAQGRYADLLVELRISQQALPTSGEITRAVERAKRLVEIDDHRADFASGARPPESPVEAAEVGLQLGRQGVTAFASDLLFEALAEDAVSVVERIPLVRHSASRLALRAAAGDGQDAGALASSAKTRCRQESLRLLRQDVEASLQLGVVDPAASVRQRIEVLLFDPALLDLRDPTRRLLLPAAEARSWEAFFEFVREALRRARA